MTRLCVAYVLLRFPCVTETFIAEEIRSIQMKGMDLCIFSLLSAPDRLVHPVSQQLLSQVHYVPGPFSASLWLAQVHFLLKAPAKYFELLTTILKEPAPRLSFLPKRVAIFLKGTWVARQLEHTPVQLVHTHFAWLPAVAGIVVSRLLGISFTVTAHAYDIYSERNDLLRLASSLAARVVTISEANKLAILTMNRSLAPTKVEVLHCGIDLHRFHPSPARSINKTLEITSVGSLLPKKGHEFLIRACGELEAQRVDFECVIVGGGELEQCLNNLICELGLRSKVTLVGVKSQDWIRDRLGKSDLFVLACVTGEAGDRDGIPVALMEAMAMGVPVISTPVSGIPELVRDEKTGLLVPEHNSRELAAAMVRLANNARMRHRLIKNGLELVSSEYNIVQNTSRLRDLFEQSARTRNRLTGNPA